MLVGGARRDCATLAMAPRKSKRIAVDAAATHTFDTVTALMAVPVQENLFPCMTVADLCRLAGSCKSLKEILTFTELSAYALRELGPIDTLLSRARALVRVSATSHDVWLWEPPNQDDPIEIDRGVDGCWVRDLVAFLEGNASEMIRRRVDRADGDAYREDYYEDSEPQGPSRTMPANSRVGILQRIDALEAKPPLEILKAVRQVLSRCYLRTEGSSTVTSVQYPFRQRLAWEHCVRFGLDGLLPLVLEAHSPTHPTLSGSRRRQSARKTIVPLTIDDFFDEPIQWSVQGMPEMNRNALSLSAYLGHASTLAALVRMGATCRWDDESTYSAFVMALCHNRRDIIRCFCTPIAAGGCGLQLTALPRKKRMEVWDLLTNNVDRYQYHRTWLGPEFDPDELLRIHCNRVQARCIRYRHVWAQIAEMFRLLAECGMPMRKLLPQVSDERLAEFVAWAACGHSDLMLSELISGLPRKESLAMVSLTNAYVHYRKQREEVLPEADQFVEWVRGLWPASAVAASPSAAGVSSDEGESEGEDESESESDGGSDDSSDGSSDDSV